VRKSLRDLPAVPSDNQKGAENLPTRRADSWQQLVSAQLHPEFVHPHWPDRRADQSQATREACCVVKALAGTTAAA